MTKLFLTSAGFTSTKISDNFLAELTKPVSESKILIVAYAQNADEEFYVNQSKNEIEQLGFKAIQVVNMDHQFDISSLPRPDVIYVCGGNTFAILKKLRETKLDQFIINNVNGGSIYVGVSAGSIIAGPNIEIAGWGSEGDKNDVGLQDLKGFDFVNIAVFPHYCEELKTEVEDYKKKVGYRVEALTNEQAICVSGDQIQIIGKE